MKKSNNKKMATIVAGTIIATNMGNAHAQTHKLQNVNAKTTKMTMNTTQERKSVNLNIHAPERSAAQMNKKNIQGKRMMVGATAYTNDPITFTGTVPVEGITIAADPNVIPFGTKVYIPQFDRVFIVEDCGSKIKGNRIDIFMNGYDKCMEWGYKDIEIYVLN